METLIEAKLIATASETNKRFQELTQSLASLRETTPKQPMVAELAAGFVDMKSKLEQTSSKLHSLDQTLSSLRTSTN